VPPRGPGRRRAHGRLLVEHLHDPLRRDDRARHQHEHHGGDHHRHQDVDDVAQEGGQGPDLHLPGVDPAATEPQDCHAGRVHHEQHRREHQGHQLAYPQGRVEQRRVRHREPLGLAPLAHERPDHAEPGDLLAEHGVDPIDPLLHGPEVRDHPADDQAHRAAEYRHDHQQQPGQRDVLAQRHHHPADQHDRCHHHDREGQQHHHLYLLDVVGGAGDQGRRPEVAHLPGGEVLHPAEQPRAQVPAERHRDPGAEVDRHHRRHHLQHADRQHPGAEADDVPGVTGRDAVVDDVRVQAGQVQGRQGLDQLQHQHHRDRRGVRTQVLPKQPDQHVSLPAGRNTTTRTQQR
jgi:hypothetical protein